MHITSGSFLHNTVPGVGFDFITCLSHCGRDAKADDAVDDTGCGRIIRRRVPHPHRALGSSRGVIWPNFINCRFIRERGEFGLYIDMFNDRRAGCTVRLSRTEACKAPSPSGQILRYDMGVEACLVLLVKVYPRLREVFVEEIVSCIRSHLFKGFVCHLERPLEGGAPGIGPKFTLLEAPLACPR